MTHKIPRNVHRNVLYLNRDHKNFIDKELKTRMALTPDMPELRESGDHLVFVYGTLMSGLWNNYYLRNAKFLGDARTVFESYGVYDAGFPVLRQLEPNEGNFVFGEVYAVDADTMMNLDYLESNGVMYQRKEVPIKMYRQEMEKDNRNKVYPVRDCWTYFGVDNYWDDYEKLEELSVVKHLATQPLGVSFRQFHKERSDKRA